ncbi:MAG: ketoacyl-ACP synthase III [Pseudoruegeria sp.]
MSGRNISNINLRAVATAVPEHIVTGADFAALFGENEAARISKGTGIQSVREGKGLKTSDLIIAACQSLFDSGVVGADEIDGVVVTTQTPDSWSPGTSFAIQDRLNLAKDCFLTDITAGCAGYITALAQGSALVSAGVCKKVLVCTGDITTQLIDERDRHVRMLFGDAASVTLIETGTDSIDFVSGADGSGSAALGVTVDYGTRTESAPLRTIGNLHMDGTAVMNFALATVPATIKDLCAASDLQLDDIDLLVLHQANEFIINYLRRMIGIASEKLPVDVDGLGNTSSTSIPYVLSRHENIGTAKAKSVVLCGFGAGLSWGAMRVDLSKMTSVAPVVVNAANAARVTPPPAVTAAE